MKRIPVLAVLAALGLAVAGCASGKKADSTTTARVARPRVHVVRSVVAAKRITVVGHATFAHLNAGTRIGCKGDGVMELPRLPVGASQVTSIGPRSVTMKLTRAANGRVTVSCSGG